MSKNSKHTYAIGDVHGCAQLLKVMLDEIDRAARLEGIEYRVVFLGDIIDRGPDSRGAMELVISTLRDIPGSKLVLGNHESLLLRAIDGDDFDIYRWTSQGGDATLHSYGVPASEMITAKAIRSVIGEEHLACMQKAEHYIEFEHHILVHAGIRPGIPIKCQSHHDLMWIREGFLDYADTFGKTIVHGHTPTAGKEVEIWPNRIAIDTHAYASNILSAVQISPSGGISVLQSESTGGYMLLTTQEEPRQMNWKRS